MSSTALVPQAAPAPYTAVTNRGSNQLSLETPKNGAGKCKLDLINSAQLR